MKLVALYRTPSDPVSFEKEYFKSHIPLLEQVPGLESTRVHRFTRTVMGEDFYMMAVMHFKDEETLKQAMRSPEMKAAGENLQGFAGGLVTLLYAESV